MSQLFHKMNALPLGPSKAMVNHNEIQAYLELSLRWAHFNYIC